LLFFALNVIIMLIIEQLLIFGRCISRGGFLGLKWSTYPPENTVTVFLLCSRTEKQNRILRNVPVKGWSAGIAHTEGLSFLLILPSTKLSSTISLPCNDCNGNTASLVMCQTKACSIPQQINDPLKTLWELCFHNVFKDYVTE